MVIEDSQVNVLPWVEKYRPETLDDLVSHTEIILTIKSFIEEKQLPHLLFYGPPGTGKTSTILACCRQMYSSKQMSSMVLELNASDDRGIGVVREQILNFASTKNALNFTSNPKYKIVILDEADSMTRDAQNALRRVIEKYSENVRFCIICNYINKLIPAIQSRCTRFRFSYLRDDQIIERLNYIIEKEALSNRVTKDGKEALLTLAKGDMRKVLHVLQATSLSSDIIDEESVYTCVGHPLPNDIANVYHWLLNDDLPEAYKKIMELKTIKGLALIDILSEIHVLVLRTDFPTNTLIEIFAALADIEYRLSKACNEKIQVTALISAFQSVKTIKPDSSDK